MIAVLRSSSLLCRGVPGTRDTAICLTRRGMILRVPALRPKSTATADPTAAPKLPKKKFKDPKIKPTAANDGLERVKRPSKSRAKNASRTKEKGVVHDRATSELQTLCKSSPGLELQWSESVLKGSHSQQVWEAEATLFFDCGVCAPGKAGSLVGHGVAPSNREAKDLASEELISMLKTSKKEWLREADTRGVATPLLYPSSTADATPNHRSILRSFADRHDLVRGAWRSERRVGLWRAEAVVELPFKAGELPRGASLPTHDRSDQEGPRFECRGEALACDRAEAELLADEQLADKLTRCGLLHAEREGGGVGKNYQQQAVKLSGLTSAGLSVREHDTAKHLLELVSTRKPWMGEALPVSPALLPSFGVGGAEAAGGSKKGGGGKNLISNKSKKKGPGKGQTAFAMEYSPVLDGRVVGQEVGSGGGGGGGGG
eukprot:CAMPEP_0171936346 /NCGR_PEP_ID=MMETSP0993-20121228/33764_1 /TAXON_ID=483369 /ORGANISM="non described non described, Strain CCMP2098" /LENGTH=431 /DNA_ID=CAMNT_0012577505 /DNA_START=71 /DNA_END=1363 /DNA_ORIENTATION=-